MAYCNRFNGRKSYLARHLALCAFCSVHPVKTATAKSTAAAADQIFRFIKPPPDSYKNPPFAFQNCFGLLYCKRMKQRDCSLKFKSVLGGYTFRLFGDIIEKKRGRKAWKEFRAKMCRHFARLQPPTQKGICCSNKQQMPFLKNVFVTEFFSHRGST
jgi:hypothetical protein